MATYGASLLGQSFYGDVAPSLFRAESFLAVPSGYGDVQLTWTTPGGDWEELRVVSNRNGYPSDETNGVTVYTAAIGADAGRAIDRGLLTDRWMYYSIFVYNAVNGIWLRSGNARVFVPSDYAGGKWLYNRLPEWMKAGDYDTSLGVNPITQKAQTNNLLAALCGLFGYQYDLIRNMLNSSLDLYDAGAVCYDLIPAMLQQFNVMAEPEIGPEQARRLLRNIIFLYQTKGSAQGIHALVSAMTGWDSYTRVGTNLLWDAEHSDFVGGIGYWAAGAVNCAPTYRPGTNTLDDAMRIVAVASGNVSTSFVTPDNVAYLGLLVHPAVDYNVSAVVEAGDVTHAPMHLRIDWYDNTGTLISSDDGTPTPTTTGENRLSTIGTAPAGAMWLGVTVLVDSATGGSWWLVKHVQINRNAAQQPAEPGRDIHIVLRSQRTNVVPNGSFGAGLAEWVQGPDDVALTLDETRAAVGGQSGKMVYTGTGLALTDPVPTNGLPHVSLEFDTVPGLRYVLQVQVASTPAGATAPTLGLVARDDPLGAGNGLRRGGIVQTFPAHDFALYAFPFIADATKTSFVAYFRAATTNDEVWLDTVLAEVQSEGTDADVYSLAAVRPYFDGATGSITGDYLWEGTPYDSPSHFYSRRTIHEARLRAMLDKFLPVGATYTLLWAQPDEEDYSVGDVILVESAPVYPTTPVSKKLNARWQDEILVSKLLRARWRELA